MPNAETSPRPERLLNGGHREEEFVGMVGQRLKLMMEIKGSRAFVQGFDNDADRRNLRGVFPASMQSVHEEKSPEVLAAAGSVDCQPA